MNSVKFSDLKVFLESKSISIETQISNDELIKGIGSLEFSNKDELTFFNNEKYKNLLTQVKAKGCFIQKKYLQLLPKNCLPITVEEPYLAYALTTNFFSPDFKSTGLINKNVNISDKSILGKNVQINHNVTIKNNCKIGENCILLDNSIIGPNVEIGSDTLVNPNSVISNAKIGKNCFIQSGVIIGDKGFGFTTNTKIEIKHIGNVIIGNNVDIGSNTTIDKGSLDSTIIEDNVRIDNLVQIAHNVKLGKNSIIASQTGIAGSTIIGKNCIIGGQVGIAGHLIIGNNVTIAAKSGVTKNIKDNSVIAGFPAIDIKIWKKNIINQMKNLK